MVSDERDSYLVLRQRDIEANLGDEEVVELCRLASKAYGEEPQAEGLVIESTDPIYQGVVLFVKALRRAGR